MSLSRELNRKIKLLLIGGGGHCRSCIDVIRSSGSYEIIGIIDVTNRVGSNVDGVPVVATDDDLSEYLAKTDQCLITVGQINSANLRKELYDKVRQKNGEFATIISLRAHVSEAAKVGRGTIIMHDSIVNAGAEIGENSILNTQSLVEHGVRIGSHVHLSTKSTINGDAIIGDQCFIGSHAVVFNQCNIGNNSIVGGGQVVRFDLAANSNPSDI